MEIARRSISCLEDKTDDITADNKKIPTEFDKEEIGNQLNLLLNLLDNNDMDAESCLSEIKQLIGHIDKIAEDLRLADNSLEQLDLRTARSHIKEIIRKLGL